MQKRGRGRPRFKPTPAHRRTVEQMVACGESQDRIARAIGIATNTLVEHFSDELQHGLARRRSEVLELLFKSARKGNVSAQKALAGITGLAAAADAVAAMGQPKERPARAAPPAKVGKKEAAQAAAENAGAGTEWGDDLHIGTGGRPN